MHLLKLQRKLPSTGISCVCIRHGDEYKNKFNIPDLPDICCFIFLGPIDPDKYEATNITLLYSSLSSLSAYAPQISIRREGLSFHVAC